MLLYHGRTLFGRAVNGFPRKICYYILAELCLEEQLMGFREKDVIIYWQNSVWKSS